MGIMDDIRSVLVKETGQEMGLFSFNSLGACPKCGGKGELKPDVAFADPVTIPCDKCEGTKYSEEALSYEYRGKNIVEILDITVKEGLEFFEKESIIHRLETLMDVGLGYLKLGQATSTLSGGELQRLKLASQLQHSGKIYILDEPSTGLHPVDVDHILNLFNKLVDQGNTVIVIEHNLIFTSQADWVIELGPVGGREGGYLIFEGRLDELIKTDTPTGKWLIKSVED